MTEYQFPYTATGSEPPGGPHLGEWILGPWTVGWSFWITSSVPSPNSPTFVPALWHGNPSGGGTGCWHELAGFPLGGTTTGHFSEYVTPGSPDYACVDFTYVSLGLDPGSVYLAAGVTYTLHIECNFLPVAKCAYGTQKKDPSQTVVHVTNGLLDALGVLAEGWWAVAAIIAQHAPTVWLDHLCSHLPPEPQPITATDWLPSLTPPFLPLAYGKIGDNFDNALFQHFCQCTPAPIGSPDPVGPTVVNWSAPTYIVDTHNTTISETQLAVTINQLFQYFLSIQFNSASSTPMLVQAAECCETNYTLGTEHLGLEGSGSVAVSGLAGVLIRILDRPDSTRQLEGNPPYLWDMAWITLSNGDGMIEEKRLTRDTQVWLPNTAKLATLLGWYAWPGVTLTLVELLPVSP